MKKQGFLCIFCCLKFINVSYFSEHFICCTRTAVAEIFDLKPTKEGIGSAR